MIRFLRYTGLCATCLFAPFGVAISSVSTDDVRQADTVAVDKVAVIDGIQRVQLSDDGTWSYLPGGRYATAVGGARIKLEADGSWHVVESTVPASASPGRPSLGSILVLLKVEILKKQKKRAKSTHTDTRTVFHIDVRNETDKPVELDEYLASRFSVQTSSGTTLPVETVSYSLATIEPGASGRVTVTADGSPRWFGVKRLELLIAPHTLGNVQQQILAKGMADVEFRSVDNF